MKPWPLVTKSISAVFCETESGSSPLVSANITTSKARRLSAESADRSSVALIENSPVDPARLAIAWRAAGIDSCLNAAVVVSINTRTGVRPDGCATDVGVVDGSPDEQATTSTDMMSGAHRAPLIITARVPCA
jgi:hypothetical protein